MRFTDIFAIDRVTTELRSEDKQNTLRELARLFVESDRQLDEDTVFRTFSDRERLASTGVGEGVAIPHARLSGVSEVEGAVAISPQGVPFDTVDGQPAQIFIAVLAPSQHTGHQLKMLARISRVLKDADVRRRLLAAKDRERVLSIMYEEEERYMSTPV